MSFNKPKPRLIGALAVLAAMALAASCRGFFVKPTLTSIAVGPASPSIQTGNTNNTVQMFAVGTFNDGSTGNPSVSWTVDKTDIATISPSGLVTAVATGPATVTATANQNPSIKGTQSITVIAGCILSIAISPTSASISVSGSNHTANFTATAQTCDQKSPNVDVTSSATWNSSNTQVATVAGGVVTAVAQGTVTISATAGGVTSTTNATVNVGP